MIRWYDWIVAFFLADFMFGNIMVVMTAEVWYMNIWGVIAAYVAWDIWNDSYIPFRKRREKSNK